MDSLLHSVTPLNGAILDPRAVVHHVGATRGMHVADFGCGSGHFVFALAAAVGDRGTVYAIDASSDALAAVSSQARAQGLTQVTTRVADLVHYESTGIQTGSVDMVFIVNNQIDEQVLTDFMREAARVLKRGGRMVLIDLLAGGFSPIGHTVHQRVEKETALLRAAGLRFVLVDEFRPGRYHYGLMLEKS